MQNRHDHSNQEKNQQTRTRSNNHRSNPQLQQNEEFQQRTRDLTAMPTRRMAEKAPLQHNQKPLQRNKPVDSAMITSNKIPAKVTFSENLVSAKSKKSTASEGQHESVSPEDVKQLNLVISNRSPNTKDKREQKSILKQRDSADKLLRQLSPVVPEPVAPQASPAKKQTKNEKLIDLYVESDDANEKAAILKKMNKGSQLLHEQQKAAKRVCGLDTVPGLFDYICTEGGQPLIGQLDIKPWDQRQKPVYKLVMAKHLFGGGLFDYRGDWRELENDITMENYYDKIMLKLFSQKVRQTLMCNPQTKIKTQLHLINIMRLEGALSQLLCRPCLSHYCYDGPNYVPYLKNQSHRALVYQSFWEDDDIESCRLWFEREVKKNRGPNTKELKQVYEGILQAFDERVKRNIVQTNCEKGGAVVSFNVGDKNEQGLIVEGIQQLAFDGVRFQHATVTVEKTQSTCSDQLKKGRKVSEMVVSLGQALQCYTDRSLLLSGIPTTADLCHILRLQRPTMFEDDEFFVQTAAVANSTPFSIDAALLKDATIAAGGSVNKADASITSVNGKIELKPILRFKISPESPSLESTVKMLGHFLNGVIEYLEEQCCAEEESPEYVAEMKKLKLSHLRGSPVVQVNVHHQEWQEKYCYVSNIRIDEANRHSVLLRDITQPSKKYASEHIREHLSTKQMLEKTGEEDQFDLFYANTQPSENNLKMTPDYRKWGEQLPTVRTNSKLVFEMRGRTYNCQDSLIQRWGQHGIYNKHIAITIANYLNPKSQAFKMDTDRSKIQMSNFIDELEIKSVELYMPVYTFLDSTADEPSFATYLETINFLFARAIFANELGKHADILDIDRNPGEVFRLLREDIFGEASIFSKKSRYWRFQQYEELQKQNSDEMFGRAKQASSRIAKRTIFKEDNAKTFTNKYLVMFDQQVMELTRRQKTIPRQVQVQNILLQQKQEKQPEEEGLAEMNNEQANQQQIQLSNDLPMSVDNIVAQRQSVSNVQESEENLTFGITLSKENMAQLHPNTVVTLQSNVFLSLFEAMVKGTEAYHQNQKAGFLPLSIAAQVNQEMLESFSAVDRPLITRVMQYFLSKNVADMSLIGPYVKDCMENGVLYEMMASPNGIFETENDPVVLREYGNSRLPIRPLIHLPNRIFAEYLLARPPKKTFAVIDASEQYVFLRMFDNCHAILAAWMLHFQYPYYLRTFRVVFLKEPFAWINFLKALGIELILPKGELQQNMAEWVWSANPVFKVEDAEFSKMVDKGLIQPAIVEAFVSKYQLVISIEVDEMATSVYSCLKLIAEAPLTKKLKRQQNTEKYKKISDMVWRSGCKDYQPVQNSTEQQSDKKHDIRKVQNSKQSKPEERGLDTIKRQKTDDAQKSENTDFNSGRKGSNTRARSTNITSSNKDGPSPGLQGNLQQSLSNQKLARIEHSPGNNHYQREESSSDLRGSYQRNSPQFAQKGRGGFNQRYPHDDDNSPKVGQKYHEQNFHMQMRQKRNSNSFE